jgi:hypothetical protein
MQAGIAAVLEQQLTRRCGRMPQMCPKSKLPVEKGLTGQLRYVLSCGDVVVELRGLEPLTPCMPCSFGLLPHRRSEAGAKLNGLLPVTVSVRWIPLVTAACGTWVARPARTTIVRVPATAPSVSAG